MDVLFKIFQDAFFAAVAAIGFASISNPPRGALKYCALIAATGHATRFCLLNYAGVHIVAASLAGALLIGILAVWLAPKIKCPPEAFSYPALLPMIPGMYAYHALQAFILSLSAHGEDEFQHLFYLSESNAVICIFIILAMVIGQMLPILVFKRRSFTSTR
ncbi:MAG: threonine/serine exporter family protein [Muribaculaceae bacterium]|nr:threonine/serine exporter family protein [Muribaculaceae bacterium]